MKKKYGLETRSWTKPLRSKMMSIEAFIGCAGFSCKSIAHTPREMFMVIEYVYGLTTDEALSFESRVSQAHSQISGMSKARRQKLQRRSRDRLVAIGHAAFAKEVLSGVSHTPDRKPVRIITPVEKAATPKPKSFLPKEGKTNFYKSWDWRTLRMEVLKERGRRCECCGATPSDTDMAGNPVKICVDHIKPLSRYWHLRLDKTNLQVLCDECNQGKGAWDETDWRSPANDDGIPEQMREQLRYHI